MYSVLSIYMVSKLTTQPVFELRKNKWLSHGQPGYNFWLSVQGFGCPYLGQGKQLVAASSFTAGA